MPVNRFLSILLWFAVGAAALFALYTLAVARGESVNALWLVTAAVCIYLIGYRFYARFIARRVLRIDPSRPTPAHRLTDGLDYVPTNKYVLFGHHFAAIAGAGPLVGPVLAAQMGYLPGALWLVVGVVFAGAVQDFLVLFISTRRDGRSLGDLIKTEMGETAGLVAMIGILAIMVILLAVLGLVVIKALADSPVGNLHRLRHASHCRAHGRLWALSAARTHRRDVAHRLYAAHGEPCARPLRRREATLLRRSSPSRARRWRSC